MKKKLSIFSALALIGLLLMAGCSNLLEQDLSGGKDENIPLGTGSVQVQIGGADTARNLAPATPGFTEYEFSFTASGAYLNPADGTWTPHPTEFLVTYNTIGNTTFDLPPDTYSLVVTGFTGARPDLKPIAKNVPVTVTVVEGKKQIVNVVLSESADPTAKGTFTYDIKFPQTFTGLYSTNGITGSSSPYYKSAKLSLTPQASSTNKGNVYIADLLDKDVTTEGSNYKYLKSIDLPSGLYEMELALETWVTITPAGETTPPQPQRVYRFEYVYIFPGQTTNAPYTFAQVDFDSYVHLAVKANIWGTQAGNYTPGDLYINSYNWDDSIGGQKADTVVIPYQTSWGGWDVVLPSRFIAQNLTTIDFRFKANKTTGGSGYLYSLWQRYTIQPEHLQEDVIQNGVGGTSEQNYVSSKVPNLYISINEISIENEPNGNIFAVRNDKIANILANSITDGETTDAVYGAPVEAYVQVDPYSGYISNTLGFYETSLDSPVNNGNGGFYLKDVATGNYGTGPGGTVKLDSAVLRRGTNAAIELLHTYGFDTSNQVYSFSNSITDYVYTVNDSSIYSTTYEDSEIRAAIYTLQGTARIAGATGSPYALTDVTVTGPTGTGRVATINTPTTMDWSTTARTDERVVNSALSVSINRTWTRDGSSHGEQITENQISNPNVTALAQNKASNTYPSNTLYRITRGAVAGGGGTILISANNGGNYGTAGDVFKFAGTGNVYIQVVPTSPGTSYSTRTITATGTFSTNSGSAFNGSSGTFGPWTFNPTSLGDGYVITVSGNLTN
ncbi:hypothetical protein FACS1894109_00350 [Spirochaetia bacterium]|nr:hypothetical protein FACS1894109_00350 [Spirochaetia bacterium]